MPQIVIGYNGERWKHLSGWGSKYLVSEQGRLARRVMINCLYSGNETEHYSIIQTDSARGDYQKATLTTEDKKLTVYLHKVVADLWVERPGEECWQVVHINGDRHDNRASNLQWVNPEEYKKKKVHDREKEKIIERMKEQMLAFGLPDEP